MTNDNDTVDGVNGWEEYVVACAAWRIKSKKDDSYGQLNARKAELAGRIKSMANVDYGEPARVQRRHRRRRDPFLAFMSNVSAFAIRNDILELYYYSGYVP